MVAEELLKLLEPLAIKRPDIAFICFSLFTIVTFIRTKVKEHEGWMSRHDREFEKRDKREEDFKEAVRVGIMEERKHQQEIHINNNLQLLELIKDVNKIKGKLEL